jgi:two-component system, OmpR family, sensor histidine kinase KdpD
MGGLDARPVLIRVTAVFVALIVATGVTAVLEQLVGLPDASAVFLVPVVMAAALLGTWAAVATSLAGFLTYDFLFTTPRFTFEVSEPTEWLSLLLFLIVAVVIGRLAALLGDRADEADRRVREGVALVAMSRAVAMTTTFDEASAVIAQRLAVDAEMDAVWVRLEGGALVASSGSAVPERPGTPWTLVRSADEPDSAWLRVRGDEDDDTRDEPHYVVAIPTEEGNAGSIHATRRAGDPQPGRGARRLLALAADQLGIALRRDELRAELTQAEVARAGDALRGAILDSVSHDLRTPVASIRALAGGLADAAAGPDPEAARATAIAIDLEATRLGTLLNSLLDMGRIQAGALRPDVRPYELVELVDTTLRGRTVDDDAHPTTLELPDDLPPVLADAVLFDVAFGNVIDNARTHTPDGTEIVVIGTSDAGTVTVEVDDGGPGVPPEALSSLFDRFYRVHPAQATGSRGIGMGLAIARGFVEAMGGTIDAHASPMGGLGVRIVLPAAGEAQP